MPARQSPPGDDATVYDEIYYRQTLHREHWFRNNRAKHDARWRDVLRMVAPSKSDTVLDLGCAIGEHTYRMARLAAQVIAVDSSPMAIRMARERNERGADNVKFICADVSDLSVLADQCIDKVMAIDLVEHIDDDTLHSM